MADFTLEELLAEKERRQSLSNIQELPLDDLLAEKDRRQAESQSSIGMGLYKGLQGVMLGGADEVGAAGNAVIDKVLYGKDFGDSYSQYVAGAREQERLFDETSPVISTGSEIVGALLNPIDKMTKLGNVGKAALEGSIYGFNTGEGGAIDRTQNAATNAATGAILTKGLEKLGGAFPGFAKGNARKLEQSAAGITAADRARMVKGAASKAYQRTGKHPIDRAVDTAKELGVFKDVGSPEQLMLSAQNKIDELDNAVSGLIRAADDFYTQPIPISFDAAEKAVKRATKGTDQRDAVKFLNDEVAAYLDGWDGSLTGLHEIKKFINKKAYSADPKLLNKEKLVDREIAKVIRRKIEGETNKLAKNKLLDPKMLEAVKTLNRQEGDLLSLVDIFRRQAAKDGADDMFKKLIRSMRTSGGFGVPALSGMYLGMPGLGVAAGLAGGVAMSPKGRVGMASALRGSVPAVEAMSKQAAKSVRPAYAMMNEVERPREETNTNRPQQSNLPLESDMQASYQGAKKQTPSQLEAQQSEGLEERPYPYSRQDIAFTQGNQNVKRNSPELKAFIEEQPPIIQAIIQTESAGDPKAVSPVGAQGLMQMMPAMQKAFDVQNPFDVRENVRGGTALFKEELDRFKDVRLALAAYNAGSPAVNRAIKRAKSRKWEQVRKYLPKETRNYVPKVEKALANITGEPVDTYMI